MQDVTVYRKNLPAISISDGMDKEEKFCYTIAWDNIKDSAETIQSMFNQFLERGSVKAVPGNRVYLPNGQVVDNAHDETLCENRGCAVHHPSVHYMSKWSQQWKDGGMYRICPEHSLPHPDPDDETLDREHKCCGCCVGDRKQKKTPLNLKKSE